MIFSIICEELGLFGAVCVILLFLLLIWRFLVIANNASDLFGALIVVGIMAHATTQKAIRKKGLYLGLATKVRHTAIPRIIMAVLKFVFATTPTIGTVKIIIFKGISDPPGTLCHWLRRALWKRLRGEYAKTIMAVLKFVFATTPTIGTVKIIIFIMVDIFPICFGILFITVARKKGVRA